MLIGRCDQCVVYVVAVKILYTRLVVVICSCSLASLSYLVVCSSLWVYVLVLKHSSI